MQNILFAWFLTFTKVSVISSSYYYCLHWDLAIILQICQLYCLYYFANFYKITIFQDKVIAITQSILIL